MSSVETAPAVPVAAAVEKRGAGGVVDLVFRVRELGLVVALGLLVLGTYAAEPRFLSAQNLRDIGLNVAIVALLAVGETVVVVSRNIDLSVGSVLGFSAFATGTLFVDHPHIAIPLVFVVGIAIGAAFGAINGALTSLGRVPSLVVTLGTLYIVRGADFAWA